MDWLEVFGGFIKYNRFGFIGGIVYMVEWMYFYTCNDESEATVAILNEFVIVGRQARAYIHTHGLWRLEVVVVVVTKWYFVFSHVFFLVKTCQDWSIWFWRLTTNTKSKKGKIKNIFKMYPDTKTILKCNIMDLYCYATKMGHLAKFISSQGNQMVGVTLLWVNVR